MHAKGTIAIALAALAAAAAASAEPPTSRPAVPKLVVGEGSFVVEGSVRAEEGGCDFYVAASLTAERAALVDRSDGTPIYLSDGRRTLVYDLAGDRILLVPNSRGGVAVDYYQDRGPVFIYGVHVFGNGPDLGPNEFRLDRFAQSARPGDDGVSLEHVIDGVRSVLTPVAGGFRLTSPYCDLVVSDIGRPIDRSRLKFPDVAQLRAAGLVVEERDLTASEQPVVAPKVVLDTDAPVLGLGAKLGLAWGGKSRRTVLAAAPDSDALRRRDRRLGADYRAALAKQGITFGPATRPVE